MCFYLEPDTRERANIVRMDDRDDQSPAERECDMCGEPMTHLATLPAMGTLPMKRVYRCAQCNFAVADADDPPGGHGRLT
jgi:hypothetical protein